MNKYGAGALAGVVATAVLSAIMLMKAAMGVMPELDVIGMLSGMLGESAIMAWIVHFAIGIIWGLLFAAIIPSWTGGGYWWKGAVLLIGPWLVMMIVLMPMVGGGMFGTAIGPMVWVATLILHLIFGAVLGATYAALVRRSGEATTTAV